MKKFYIAEEDLKGLSDEERKYNKASYKRVIERYITDMIQCDYYVRNNFENLELYSGSDYDEEDDYYYDVFQYFLIDGDIEYFCRHMPEEIVYYDSVNDWYILGVTHCGTHWSYVLTDLDLTTDFDEWLEDRKESEE